MDIYFDTCVLPRCRLESAALYRDKFGSALGIELLPMFDMQPFESDLKKVLTLLRDGPLTFHEPVWGVEHTAPQGSLAWQETMFHLLLTRKYAEILHPSQMVYHLNNCVIPREKRDELLQNSLRNLDAVRKLFPSVTLLIENTGIRTLGTMILDQEEFTSLCLSEGMDVLIDVGHANANGWDLYRLISDLGNCIRGFHLHNNDGTMDLHNRLRNGTVDYKALIPFIVRTVPDAYLVIEYTREEYHGDPLCDDIIYLQSLLASPLAE